MKKIKLILGFIASFGIANAQKAPDFMIGTFTDDYKITYTITDTLWIQHPNSKYHIVKWNADKQYLIVKNDVANKSDANKYTRIDYMTFTGMAPYLWGFCLTIYDAATDQLAEATASADRENPKKGCNGYPFSRMKRNESIPVSKNQ